uniref:Uncharacterized protein n=1 Tax=Vespula pensylvanica TaxID=30213 RepID=A0A834U9H4_VESPE|nr:hypothetical protein H0235_008872 [Vespula pensylvanica]
MVVIAAGSDIALVLVSPNYTKVILTRGSRYTGDLLIPSGPKVPVKLSSRKKTRGGRRAKLVVVNDGGGDGGGGGSDSSSVVGDSSGGKTAAAAAAKAAVAAAAAVATAKQHRVRQILRRTVTGETATVEEGREATRARTVSRQSRVSSREKGETPTATVVTAEKQAGDSRAMRD